MGAVLIGLHSATFALLGVLAILAFLHQRRSVTGRLLIALCLSLMALMISTLPLGVGLPPEILWTARIMDVPNTVLAWLFITSMMQDGFKIEAKHVAISLAYCVGAWSLWLNHFVEWTPYIRQVSWAVNLGVLALFLNLLLQVWQQRRSDLVETRRTLRLVFIVSVVSTVAVSILSEIFLRPNAPELVDLNKMLITLLLVAVGLVWFTRIPADHIAFAATLPQPGTATDQGRLTAKTKAQLDHLHRAMDDDELWRDPDMNPEKLSATMAVGERHLRKLINEHLGYRNFRSFLASYRVAAVKRALSDPLLRDQSVSTLAFDCGFNSVASFNRIFKQQVGQSPMKFRQQNLCEDRI